MDVLVVVDMQKDFISGALGTKEAVAIVPRVAKKKIAQAKKRARPSSLPVTPIMKIICRRRKERIFPCPTASKTPPAGRLTLRLDTTGARIFDKPSFGSEELVQYLKGLDNLTSAEFVGLCTDICVLRTCCLANAHCRSFHLR